MVYIKPNFLTFDKSMLTEIEAECGSCTCQCVCQCVCKCVKEVN